MSDSQQVADDMAAIAALSFESAQAELEQVVEKLDDPATGLDEALALWERGEALHRHCQRKLDYAAERLQQVNVDPNEVPSPAEPAADNGSDPAPAAAEPTADPAPAESNMPAPAEPEIARPAPAPESDGDEPNLF